MQGFQLPHSLLKPVVKGGASPNSKQSHHLLVLDSMRTFNSANTFTKSM